MGERVGRYELVKPLGQGGMAEVFLARQDGVAGFSKELVIKRVLPDLVVDRKFVEMFLDEARLAARLTHPNICQVFELGEFDGQYFIAMERVPGRTLTELIRAAREKHLAMPLPAALRIIAQLCEALDYAHSLVDDEGRPLLLVHRDVTPSNVMVTPDASVKLLDFGIARAATRSTRTQVGITKGKMGFMAPEQVTAPHTLDSRADLFAVGALLYLLTVGRAPYGDVPKGELLREMGLGRFPAPRQVNAKVPEEIEAVILRAMATEREARFATARDFHRAIEAAALKLGLSVGPHALRDFLGRVDGDDSSDTTQPTLKPVGARVAALAPPVPPPPPADATRAGAPLPAATPPVGPKPSRDGPTRVSARHDAPPAATADEVTRAEVEVPGPGKRGGVIEVNTADLVTGSGVTKRRSNALVVVGLSLSLLALVGAVGWVVLRPVEAAPPKKKAPPPVVAKVDPVPVKPAEPPPAEPPVEVAKPVEAAPAQPPEVPAPPEPRAQETPAEAPPPDEAEPVSGAAPRPPDVKKVRPVVKATPAPPPSAPLDLKGPVGTLRMTTTPAAKVSVGASVLGKTPLTTRLPVGTHRLRIEYPSGATHQLLINVVEGKETVVRDVAD